LKASKGRTYNGEEDGKRWCPLPHTASSLPPVFGSERFDAAIEAVKPARKADLCRRLFTVDSKCF
jgi:hypothetical protein